jgi:hypothetical protein
MTLPSSVEMINELPSLVNSTLLIGCRFDTVNLEMTVGGDDGEAKSTARPTNLMWYPGAAFEGEALRREARLRKRSRIPGHVKGRPGAVSARSKRFPSSVTATAGGRCAPQEKQAAQAARTR